MRPALAHASKVSFLLAFLSFPALAEEAGAAESGPAETSKKGFSAPSLKGFAKLETKMMDASLAVPGDETTVEVFENGAGDRVMRLSLNGVVWAYGWLPNGDPLQGHVLRDPSCSKKLTEKWAPDAAFSAPDCAVKAKAPPAPTTKTKTKKR